MGFINELCTKAYNIDGITAVEYTILGLMTLLSFYFIFGKGGFLQSMDAALTTMSSNIIRVGAIAS